MAAEAFVDAVAQRCIARSAPVRGRYRRASHRLGWIGSKASGSYSLERPQRERGRYESWVPSQTIDNRDNKSAGQKREYRIVKCPRKVHSPSGTTTTSTVTHACMQNARKRPANTVCTPLLSLHVHDVSMLATHIRHVPADRSRFEHFWFAGSSLECVVRRCPCVGGLFIATHTRRHIHKKTHPRSVEQITAAPRCAAHKHESTHHTH